MSAVAVALKDITNLSPQDLRSILNKHYPNATPVPRREGDVVSSGIVMLDQILPHRGFPKGRLSVWAPLGGATAVLRAAAYAQFSCGGRVIWIDAARSISGDSWSVLDQINGPLLIRPNTRVEALRAADVLLRSGAFSLVVLTGADPDSTENVKLARATHEGMSAFVAVASNTAMAGVKVASYIKPDFYNWKRGPSGEPALVESVRIRINVESLGWSRKGNITLPLMSQEPRIGIDHMVPDRRGAKVGR